MQKPKVTLGFKPYRGSFGTDIQGTYEVMVIAGSKPTVEYRYNTTPAMTGVARVGTVLSELEATSLGLVADLIVKPYKA